MMGSLNILTQPYSSISVFLDVKKFKIPRRKVFSFVLDAEEAFEGPFCANAHGAIELMKNTFVIWNTDK